MQSRVESLKKGRLNYNYAVFFGRSNYNIQKTVGLMTTLKNLVGSKQTLPFFGRSKSNIQSRVNYNIIIKIRATYNINREGRAKSNIMGRLNYNITGSA